MTRDARQPDGLPVPRAPYSPVVVTGDLVVTSGQVGIDAEGAVVPGGIVAQTHRAIANVAACLGAAGCGLGDVVKVTVFLADLADFEAFNDAYREDLATPFPARTTVGVDLPAGLLVEIEAIARRPGP